MITTTCVPSGDRDHRFTPRRQKILNCIHESVQSRGYPPSMREMADAVGLKSTSAVSYQLKILERMGHLTRDARMPCTVVESRPGPGPSRTGRTMPERRRRARTRRRGRGG